MKLLHISLLLAYLGLTSAHPYQFVPYDDPKVLEATQNYTAVLDKHLAPYQMAKVELLLSAQKQQVSGTNYAFAAVVREDMVFDTEKKRHGWPAHQLHWVTVHENWIEKPTVWTISRDEIVPKIMYVDPTQEESHSWLHGHADDCVDHINTKLLPNLVDSDEFSEVEQELVEYLRADVQTYNIENFAMNLTKLPDKVVMLVDVIFLTKCKNCDSDKQNIGVGVVSRNAEGQDTVISVFNEVLYQIRKRDDDKDEDDKNGGGCTVVKEGMSGGGIFALVFFMSLAVGAGAFFFGKSKGKNLGSFKVPSLDEFGSSAMFGDGSSGGGFGRGSNVYNEEEEVKGLDMRRLDIVKAEDVDRDDTHL